MKKAVKETKEFKELINSLEKKIDQLNKEKQAGKGENLTAVEVICSQEDMEKTRTRRGKSQ
ncbi:MAG: hypothetical protein MRECE_9c020 [Mycoplasmataceae bacterium CE_OT135]|nr:MAG: hypothetical protein MRECE_9c020 [Mycoplasmataceae bacterium CE_OT135]